MKIRPTSRQRCVWSQLNFFGEPMVTCRAEQEACAVAMLRAHADLTGLAEQWASWKRARVEADDLETAQDNALEQAAKATKAACAAFA
ncbi:hypothetical protein [Paraburkholderia jirisanensis]